MRRTDLSSLIDSLDAFTVGFGPLFRDLPVQQSNLSYPPHNIIKVSDNEFVIDVAVAGFKKDEVSAEFHRGSLTIKGTKSKETSSDPESFYSYRGIANRSFTKSFRIAEYYEVSDAKLEDGILSIRFIKNVPEEEKPKLITIG